jgi:hypothetical protein
MVFIAFAAIASAQERGLQLQDPLEGTFRMEETTVEHQTDVAVTVYNNNLALVRDRRKLTLSPGELSLRFSDVAQQIIPETVSLESVTEAGSLRILEQNYEYDLMSPSKLMEKYVGKPVRLRSFDDTSRFTEEEAILLSVNESPIYQVGDEIYLGHPGTVVLPELPENLIAKPSLIWLLDNSAGDQEVEATYLTNGMSWKADYVVKLERSDEQMHIDAWVTLDNNSGAPYVNAQLKLVAGDVNIVPKAQMQDTIRRLTMAEAAAAPMQEESFAEYHLYTLPRRTTIKENQSKQVSLFTASDIAVKKVYEFRGNVTYYHQRFPGRQENDVNVTLVFKNAEDNQLGVPLPAGIMRIYQEDSDGMLQFAGEDRVEHTPKDEEVRLRMGNAFDVVGERTQTDYDIIADRVREVAFEIKIRNHKDNAITVDVIEPMMGDWEILSQSHEHVKRDAMTAVFSLDVPADGETTLTYRARLRF